MDAPQAIMMAIVAWIVLLELSPNYLSPFYARKLCHAGCGLGMLFLDSQRLDCRVFVWTVASGSISMTWGFSPLPAFRFARARDVGITVYLALVSIWYVLQLPSPILAPLFFADPAGAVIGKAASRHLGPQWNPAWYEKKTVCGSIAVFALTYITLPFGTGIIRLAIATAAAGAEAVGGEYDNLAIAVVVLTGWAMQAAF